MSPTTSTPVMASDNRADVAAATPAPSRIDALDRRRMLGRLSWGLGAAALASLVAKSDRVHAADRARAADRGLAELPHHRPRAKRVIFLFQSGAPSQVDLFDHKPQLKDRHGEELPESVRRGQRLTTMTSNQATLPIVASPYRFAKHGECGAEISELLPYTAKIVDELCIVRSLHTEAINHDPAITFVQTGSQQPGRPSIGSWIDYALGAETDDLPAFVVGITGGESGDQPLNGRLWSGGFLPAVHQAVKLRGAGSPLLYLDDPPGVTAGMRRDWLARLGELNRLSARQSDAAEAARVAAWTRQFELAARMQTAVPELADLASESEHTFRLYGDDARKPGTFAANCLLARRMVERGVRFVQLFHRGWDHHQNLPGRLPTKCRQVDQPSAALVLDLKRRGLLDDTLVIWAGEFGRTTYCQGTLTESDWGRDHHPRCFTAWLAGGGIRPGMTYGATDEFSYNIESNPVHIHDLQATVLHLLGIDHERLTYRHQGRDFRLTDIAGRVVHGLFQPRKFLATECTENTEEE